ncbi:coiled-coil domain-containing protein [Niallia endozanthoxylica]|uniref:Uncharacterized protein n=1 Tax=Niallia endozanthoxylica TaxID=2036016 RepID=A0A5J5HUQ5_9BACI|nr:hypothetical protein [Niallia endozanthoxylica]KAA9024236.1 hypothetical protein F4V44_11575 [Niallia endozanthoxylica]
MVKTELPTKKDYEEAVNELKKLNDDLFYDDFKGKIKQLESHIEHLTNSNIQEFKTEAEHIVRQGEGFIRQLENQQTEMKEFIERQQQTMTQTNLELIENEKTQLLAVYEKLQKSVKDYTMLTNGLQQNIEKNNKDLVDEAIKAVSSVSDHINEFIQKLSLADGKNKEFLEQNRAYVTLTKKQITETEEKLTVMGETLQQMDERWEELFKSYEKNYQIHEQALKNLLVVREEALINKVTQLHENWSVQQYNHDEAHKAEILHWHEQVAAHIKAQSRQNEKMLETITTNLTSKADLVKTEKKQSLKTNILITVVAVEAILIGLQFII